METTNRLENVTLPQKSTAPGHEGDSGEKSHTLRAKLEAAVEKVQAAYDRLEDKTVAAAKAADNTVREHPYQTIGIAFGLGLLIGALAMRNRRD